MIAHPDREMRPVLIKIALNGGRGDAPTTAEEIAEDVAACAAAGATVFHVHARDRHGSESLQPEDVDRVVEAIRAAARHVSLGLTTGAFFPTFRSVWTRSHAGGSSPALPR